MTLSNPTEIPPREGTDAADRARQQAFEALEYVFSEDEQQQQCQYVKCQNPKCSKKNIKIVFKIPRPQGYSRIPTLQKRLEWQLTYPHGHNATADKEIKQTKQELDYLEAEETERDKTRHLPLISSKCTRYRYFCSPCWDKAMFEQEQRKREQDKIRKA